MWSANADTSREDDGASGEGSGREDDVLEEPRRKYPKRGAGRALFRQMSADQVVWFPLDNSPALMRELAHEAQARWAVHGTPASGVGVLGLICAGLTVLAIAKDKAHAEQLYQCVLQRVSQELCTPSSPLAEAALCARASEVMAKSGTKPAKPAVPPPSPLQSDDVDGCGGEPGR